MKRTLLLAISLIILLCQNAESVGKITVDPNSPGNIRPPISESSEQHEDSRLSRLITYEARHKAVKVILADLSDLTGITLRAGLNEKDWQVRDRRMNIFAKDIPLAQLMSSIARVMRFKWSINRDADPWTYRLYMDRKTLLGADAELYRAQEAFDKEITRRRENLANMIDNWTDDLSPSELEQLRRDNPYLYLLHTRGGGNALQGLFKDIPGLREAFINRGGNITVPISDLAPNTQQLVLNAVKQKFQLWAGKEASSLSGNDEKAFNNGQVSLEITPRELCWDKYQQRYFGSSGVYINGNYYFMTDFAEPSSPLAQYDADVELQAYEKDSARDNVWQQTKSEYERLKVEEAKGLENIFLIGPSPKQPDEPALHKKIKLLLDKKKKITLGDLEAALAEISGFAVVSDSFRVSNGYADIGDSETELKDILTKIGDGYRYNWDIHGDIIDFQSKYWFMMRTTQIPDDWIERWRGNFKRLGYLCIDDYAQIAMLTNPQIEENLKTDEDFSQANIFGKDFLYARLALQLYASLSSTQRKEVCSSTGLSARACGEEQRELITRAFAIPMPEPADSLQIQCTLSSGPKCPVCSLYVTDAVDSTKVGERTISLPVCAQMSGIITDKRTGSPLAGALVQNIGYPSHIPAVTDAQGRYNVWANPNDSENMIVVWHPAYAVPIMWKNPVKTGTQPLSWNLASLQVVQTITDTFTRSDGVDLGSTEDSRQLPWLKSDAHSDAKISSGAMDLPRQKDPSGVSIGGNFVPADFDMTVTVQGITGTGFGVIAYREDPSKGKEKVQYKNGFAILIQADGKKITNSLYISGIARDSKDYVPPTPIDWSVPHVVRIRAQGYHQQIWLDGEEIMSYFNGGALYNPNGKPEGGCVAFWRGADTGIRIDNISIQVLATD